MINPARASLLLTLAAAPALTACSSHGGNAAFAAEVRKDALGVVADYNAQDPRKSAAWDAPDYVGVFHGTPNVNGPAADEAGMKAGMAAARVHWQIGEGKVTVSKAGDLGIFEAPYVFTITRPDGATTSESGNWIAIFKREPDGSLKLWRSIGSDTPAVKAGA